MFSKLKICLGAWDSANGKFGSFVNSNHSLVSRHSPGTSCESFAWVMLFAENNRGIEIDPFMPTQRQAAAHVAGSRKLLKAALVPPVALFTVSV